MGKVKGRKADFQKIKLKPGRRLPKGLNVTDTSFKSKKIVLRDQHLRDAADALSNKKRGIKEILARLQHYNPGTRHECLVTLKELLVANPSLVQNNIAGLTERVCELMVDKDRAVRKAVLAVLTEMLQNVSPDFIAPFFPVFTSYLCCAMTHIFTDIQHDSLKILDLLLTTFPRLTITSSKILKNFLNQISCEQDSTKGRILLVKPGEKMTSQTWRLEVMHRVRRFLSVLVESWEEQDNFSIALGSIIEWDGTGTLNVGLLQKGLEPVLADKFCFQNWTQEKTETKDVEEVKEFCLVLVPLMFEIWLEASPDKKPHEIGSLLSSESCDILLCVLEVIWFLIQWLEKLSEGNSSKKQNYVDWFENKFYKKIETFFLNSFPFVPQETPAIKKKVNRFSSQASVSSQNLTVCQIFVALKPGIDEKSVLYYEDIVEYLMSFLTSEVIVDENDTTVTVGIVQNIIKNNVHHSLAVKLLENLEELYKQWPVGFQGQHLIESFFMEIVSSHNYNELLNTAPVTSWMENLLKDIINSNDNPERMMELLEKAGDIASCRFPAFTQSLHSCNLQLIGLLEELPFSEEDLFKAQRHILSLICNLPSISGETFRQLAQVICNPELEVRNVEYLLQNLNFRFQNKTEPGFSPSHYLSLIICTQLGVLQHEAPVIQQDFQTSGSCIRLQHFLPEISSFIVVPTDFHVWERHQHISAKAIRYIWEFPETIDIRMAIYTYVIHVLEQFRYLPAHTTAGILSLLAPFLREPELEDRGCLDRYAQLRFSLFELALSALNTAAAISLLSTDRPTNELRVAEMIFEMVTDFIVETDCFEPIWKLMERNINCLKGLSEAQGECLGLVISKLMKFEEVDVESMASIENIIQMLQTLTEGHMSRSKWLNKIIFDYKLKTGEIQ